MNKIIQCVPNFSEGRDQAIIDRITAPFSSQEGVKLLDVQADANHNRMVVTVLGSPQGVQRAVLAAMARAVESIDMTRHHGQHPRMGAVDVVPFIPIKGMEMAEAVTFSQAVAAEAAQALDLPVFLYERSATAPHRVNLANLRKGQFEGMADKLKDPMWQPDCGPVRIHPTAGVAAVGSPATAAHADHHALDFRYQLLYSPLQIQHLDLEHLKAGTDLHLGGDPDLPFVGGGHELHPHQGDQG